MKEDRQAVLKAYFGDYWVNPYIERLMGYDRYHEAELIHNEIADDRERENEWITDLSDLAVFDFGCAVGDYGIYFARLGATTTFYDFPFWIDFVKFRLNTENLKGKATFIPIGNNQLEPVLTHKDELVIFGEVLEHLSNPLQVVKRCVDAKYVFTSSYPYKDDEEYNHKGHKKQAQEQQEDVIHFLEDNFDPTALDGKAVLWRRKNVSA